MNKRWVLVETVQGELQAEILRGLLEAQGFPVLLSQEGAGRALGLNVGPLGEVEILVPEENQEEALQILDQYHRGSLEDMGEWEDGESGPDPDS